ncbi:MAG: InlB B-repeat-containing protein [Butyrivibrio sp.]|nr:InlB B-repeat-containing protein [Butyrivibrio sp.]
MKINENSDHKKHIFSICAILLIVSLYILFCYDGRLNNVFAEEDDPNRITITYHSNYPKEVDKEDKTETFTIDKGVSTYLGNTFFGCDGYYVGGWCSDQNDTDLMFEYRDDQSYYFQENIDLYTCWRKSITVTYDAGGGKFSDNTTKKINYTFENSYHSYNISEPSKEGGVFIGWFVPGKSEEGKYSTYYSNYNAQVISSSCSESITLTAMYSSDFKTIIFDANGGYFGNNTITKKTYQVIPEKSFGDITGEFDPTPMYADDSKGFIGWKKLMDSDENIVSGIWMKNFTEDTTFVAVWGDYHTVTFNAGGGYFKSGSTKTTTTTNKILDGNRIYSNYVPSVYNDNSSMMFGGWKISGTTDGKIYTKSDISDNNNKIYSDITYEALWVDPDDPMLMEGFVKVTFDAGSGYLNSQSSGIHSKTYVVPKEKSFYSLYDNYVSAVQDNYSFNGWKIQGDSSGKIYSYYEASNYAVSSDVTFVAEWSTIHTITFDLGEEYYSNINSSRYVTAELGENDPVYCHFDKWYSSPSDGVVHVDDMYLVKWKSSTDGTIYDAYSGYVYDPQTHDYLYAKNDMTLVAVWEKEIKVTFETSKGLLLPDNVKKKTIKVAPGVSLESLRYSSGVPYTDTVPGFVFKGWKIKENYNSPIYASESYGSSESLWYYVPTEDVTFEAVWNETYNVTFSSSEGYISGKSSTTQMNYTVESGGALNSSPTCSGREKYIFRGWKKEGDNTLYVANSYNLKSGEKYIGYVTISENVTFYAVWEASCMITFYSVEGYMSGSATTKTRTVNVESGGRFTSASSYSPSGRPGYLFAGWKLQGDTSDNVYEKKYEEDKGTAKSISDLEVREDIIFEAIWDEAYTITFLSPEGYINGSSGSKSSSLYVKKGHAITSYNYGWGRKDYTFVGWKLEGGDDTLYVREKADAVNGAKWIGDFVPTEDVTFNLVWVCYKKITIKSDEGYMNGSKYEYTKSFQTVAAEKLSSIPTEAKAYGRPDYSVKGYKIQGDETDTLYVENINEYTGQDKVKSIYDYVVEDDVTFLVQWMTGYEVKFESKDGFLNGKESDTEMMVSVSSESGGKIKTFPSPSREDYLFKGFVIKGTESGLQGSETDSKTVYVLNSNEAVDGKIYIGDYEVTKNVTFEALWEKDFAKLLKAAKDNAKTKLDEYAESKKLADATEAETKTYKEAVSTGKKIIDTAAVEDEIDSKLAEAKGKIDDVIVSIKVARQKAEDEKNNQGKNNETEKTTTAPGSSNNNTQPKTTQSTKKPKPVVKKKQTIKAKSKKLYYSDKTVSLGVKTNGNGKLTFKSSNPKVIKIAKNGKVKTVGLGKAKITIKAAGTSKFKPATKKITVTVVCAKQVIKSKIQWGNRVKLSWVKDKTVDGYEVQFSIDKKFDEKKTIHNFFKKNVNSTLIKPNGNYTRTYYVRVRSYRIVKGKKVFNDWSKTCTVNLN